MTGKPALALTLLAAAALAQQTPTPAAASWWRLTSALSGDSMEGRDTGSEAYERAARLVAEHFKAASLKPAGDNGSFYQRVPMHQVELDTRSSAVDLLTPEGVAEPLRLLYETTLVPRAGLNPLTQGQLVFVGYGDSAAAGPDLHGKIAVYFNNTPAGLTPTRQAAFASNRTSALIQAGVTAIVSIDNPAATEPTHWPAAYARAVTLAGAPPAPGANLPSLRISYESARRLFAGATADPARLLADAERGLPLATLPLARSLRIKLAFTEEDISSSNILAILPGSDPALAVEYVALSAHLDGYGYGTPVLGDSLYNGTLDDAAYVALLLDMADDLSGHGPGKPHADSGKLQRRSLLFCIFTGEEKGLLGSAYFTAHPTIPVRQIVADLNLDQLRPIFPLKILTMEGIADSTLGETARTVAAGFHIELRPDRETERNLYRRADNYNFVRAGVPIASFIFGYDPHTSEERAYRDWYARRYHKPQDDLATPIDWQAAVTFNEFYRALALAVADSSSRPTWLPGSPNAPGR